MLLAITKLFFYLVYLFIVDVIPVLVITGFLIYKFSNNKVIKFSILCVFCSIVNVISKLVNLFNHDYGEKIRNWTFKLLKPYEDEEIEKEYEESKK